jgi:superfamily II DNA or RNA helicase
MALRLDPVRLLIADDVGVGKTIEALLVARELFDRGEVKRLCVLCPPYLCEQWQRELAEKFNLDAVVIRAGTVGQLERRKPAHESVFRHYPIQVASIDFLKSDRNRHAFLQDCPELVIVDEAHGSAFAAERNGGQHQRHELVGEIAAKPDRHLILLSATPHSGVESAFRSLLGFLRPDFAGWNMAELRERERVELARHFVQRTRRDIEHDWEGEHCFPKRESLDMTYRLSQAYKDLFDRAYDFCSVIVRSGAAAGKRQQRARFWGALALLRCVMSSPAAAVATLETRRESVEPEDEDQLFNGFVFESADDRTDDEQPTPPVEAASATLAQTEKRQLKDLAQLAEALRGSDGDTKLRGCATLVDSLLKDGFQPIVWCRYIATADYVAEGLQAALRKSHPKARVVSITGRLNDDERRAKIDELALEPQRVLVATDCLSEGVNLQQAFNAVLHYDLPWNPNRLEQREGRVDRYGQPQPVVRAIRYFSPDSAVDGVVLEVLLNKAREIHRTLGTHVPVPAESETVTEALLNALFLRGKKPTPGKPIQQEIDFGEYEVEEFHRRWELDAEREKLNRTRFAQRALKPGEVRQELEAADAVLGDPAAVREFVLVAAQRIGLTVTPAPKSPGVYRVPVSPDAIATVPDAVRFALPAAKGSAWFISFDSPTPAGAEYLGRNHSFVSALAGFLMEEALTQGSQARAARCGVIRTRAVSRLTTLYLLRVRYLLQEPERPPLLSEEIVVLGSIEDAKAKKPNWLPTEEALRLLAEAKPAKNVGMAEKRELVSAVLNRWPRFEAAVRVRVSERADELTKAYRRVRQAVGMKVRQLTVAPQLPPDLLGILILQPVV